MHMRTRLRLSPFVLALLALPTLAQQAPNAGQLLQQNRPAPVLPKAGPSIDLPPPLAATALPGGAVITLRSLKFMGHSVFSDAELAAVLGGVVGKSFDLAGLNGLAQQLSTHYRDSGYPFARVYVPEQKLADGQVTLAIVEGCYGQVSATGAPRFISDAQGFLGALKPGAVIDTQSLARATLILSDQPGARTAPLVRPGQAFGSGDLIVEVSATPAITGEVGIDNAGSRYTGRDRLRFNLQADSPFMLGDQATLKSSYSTEGQWLGQLGYSLPLGFSGLRGQLGVAHTYYELAKEFANLQASGTARITSAGLSYPIIRTAMANLSVAATYQHKQLEDKRGATATRSDKRSEVLPLTLQFDRRDALGGGGITYGSVSLTTGRLKLDGASAAADAATAQSNGSFRKWGLDVARVQATPIDKLSLYGRATAQWASKNLDSSEDFGLGGAGGVRAYPGGEGFGDDGWVVQMEARYQLGSAAPYVFWDSGRVKFNHRPWDAGTRARSLSGGGLGVRYSSGPWSADASLAWRGHGGEAQSEPSSSQPRLWIAAGWRF